MSVQRKIVGASLDTFQLDQDICPRRGTILDACSGVVGTQPEPGALSLCVSCGGVNQFDADLRLILVAEELLNSVTPEGKALIKNFRAMVQRFGYAPRRLPKEKA